MASGEDITAREKMSTMYCCTAAVPSQTDHFRSLEFGIKIIKSSREANLWYYCCRLCTTPALETSKLCCGASITNTRHHLKLCNEMDPPPSDSIEGPGEKHHIVLELLPSCLALEFQSTATHPPGGWFQAATACRLPPLGLRPRSVLLSPLSLRQV